MFLILHITIALSSLVQTGFLLLAPSQRKLTSTYVFLGATIVSGSYLIITKPAHMMQTCVEGLLFIGFTIGGIIIAQRKLAKETA